MPAQHLSFARALRGTQTDAERALWRHLRAGRLEGFKFRRQHPVPPYVLDFYCEQLHLAVELDGSQHSDGTDAPRTRYLESHGVRVMRFWDNDVLLNIEGVIEAILDDIASRTLTPTPLPVGEGP